MHHFRVKEKEKYYVCMSCLVVKTHVMKLPACSFGADVNARGGLRLSALRVLVFGGFWPTL